MRVIQMLPTFSKRDAIGNDVINIYRALISLNYDSLVFTNNDLAAPKDVLYSTQYSYDDFSEDDIVMYHFSIGDRMTDFFANLSSKKILVYHNVTPPVFFENYDAMTERLCRSGLQQVRSLAGKVDFCLADSEWNKDDLQRMGFVCPIYVFPIMLSFEEYRNHSDGNLLLSLKRKKGTKILFVGRVAPNKCQHDLLKTFYCYKRLFDSEASLYIVGGFAEADAYYASLVNYALELGLEDVHFLGGVPFEQLTSFYGAADVFLCQSEHEGFCVPLVESMIFNVPVIAFDACAVKETMGHNTMVLDTKDPYVTAAIIDRVQKDQKLREHIIVNQQKRLKAFQHEELIASLDSLLKDIQKETR